MTTVGELFSENAVTAEEKEIVRQLAAELKGKTDLDIRVRSFVNDRNSIYELFVPGFSTPSGKEVKLATVKNIRPEIRQLSMWFADLTDKGYNRPPYRYGADTDLAFIGQRLKKTFDYFIKKK